MRKMKSILLFSVLFACFYSQAQTDTGKESMPIVAFKSNLLYDATGTINLGPEIRLDNRTTLDLPFNWNTFEFSDNRKWKHFLVQPELRLWSKKKGAFNGHFFGVHGHYAFYNIGNLPKPFSQYMRDHRFQGWLAGAGVSWGYRWNFNPRWGMEATIGAGYAYLDYDRFECGVCGEKLGNETKNYFGPTKMGLSLIYQINKKKEVIARAPVTEPLPIIPVKEVVVVSPYTSQFTASYVVPEVEAVKQRSDAGKAYLDFASGKSEIVLSFKNNAFELEKIHSLIKSVKNNPDMTITGITIKGYASPEGNYSSNQALSERRANALKNHIRVMHGLSETLFTVEGKGEDWETLDSLVSTSSISDKKAILEIIRATGIFDGREKRLMDISGGNPYREMLFTMFPKLRRSDYQVNFTVLPFSVEKGKEVFRTTPCALSLNEMFLIANTYPAGSEAFNEVFETAARLFPHDDTANLNAAANALERGDKQRARKYLSLVKEQTAAYHNNMGVLHGLLEEWDKATEAFQKALEEGCIEAKGNVAENQKAIDSRKPASETK